MFNFSVICSSVNAEMFPLYYVQVGSIIKEYNGCCKEVFSQLPPISICLSPNPSRHSPMRTTMSLVSLLVSACTTRYVVIYLYFSLDSLSLFPLSLWNSLSPNSFRSIITNVQIPVLQALLMAATLSIDFAFYETKNS